MKVNQLNRRISVVFAGAILADRMLRVRRPSGGRLG